MCLFRQTYNDFISGSQLQNLSLSLLYERRQERRILMKQGISDIPIDVTERALHKDRTITR